MGLREEPVRALNSRDIFEEEHTELPVTKRRKVRNSSSPIFPIN